MALAPKASPGSACALEPHLAEGLLKEPKASPGSACAPIATNAPKRFPAWRGGRQHDQLLKDPDPGIALVAYEGGQQIQGPATLVNYDSEMYFLYLEYLG